MDITIQGTVSTTLAINGTGDTLNIQDATATVLSDGTVKDAKGKLYSKSDIYVGNFNYTKMGGLQLHLNNSSVTSLEATNELTAFVSAVEEAHKAETASE